MSLTIISFILSIAFILKIRVSDLMNYKKRRDAERLRALNEVAQMSQELGMYD